MVFRVLVTVHIGEMTMRETLAFSARVQGVGAGHGKCYTVSFKELPKNLSSKESRD
ncbi:hypothetical protein Sjap_026234 [Stephania japonica]|uniref:Uncharacterized protein n=1 Tax=Stephania japonica TaxID=461633 RepID=A0AAP0EB13_9MAGN